jgi:hypothetical protein
MTLEITFKESILLLDSITSRLRKIDDIITSVGKDSYKIVELYSADRDALVDLQERLKNEII